MSVPLQRANDVGSPTCLRQRFHRVRIGFELDANLGPAAPGHPTGPFYIEGIEDEIKEVGYLGWLLNVQTSPAQRDVLECAG